MKVTIQDIADALGISRNTVSKAINNSDGIAADTRDRILRKAVEMGYKQFSYVRSMSELSRESPEPTAAEPNDSGEIALLTSYHLEGSHFALTMIDRLRTELANFGYTLTSHYVSSEELKQKQLPYPLPSENTKALVCFEMFDRDYDDMLCWLGLPLLFVDGPSPYNGHVLNADCILMDNTNVLSKLALEMLEAGKDRIGFIGDITHCQSFFERYCALIRVLSLAHKPADRLCLLNSNDPIEIYYILSKLEELPELFFCANDSIAIDVMSILKKLGKSVPEDVMICGFDDSEESRHVSPTLTTVHIHTQSMAYVAAQMLISRIKEPTLETRTVYLNADLIRRESTRLRGANESH
ncbi:MAG: LacI family DNA-binding transcriptional regulator [Oscillospiraceae bacterium]|nr:LacI family DNA-binding transcriptional regulator [Oscillospiraceae bacterium]MBR7011162.1 LacI family DNA-binding transcriptional regulator [Oscillospiraceae bacterium]